MIRKMLRGVENTSGVIDKCRDITKDKTCFIVSGFGRSGTSLLSRICEMQGVHFGDDHVVAKEAAASHEDQEFSKLLFDIRLQSNNRYVRKIQKQFINVKILNCIKRLAINDKWGFKVPTSTLQLNYLSPYIKNIKIIATYRDPETNIASFIKAKRDYFKEPQTKTIKEIIDYWVQVNEDLLYLKKYYDVLLVDYDKLLDRDKATFVKIAKFIGSKEYYKPMAIINPDLNRSPELIKDNLIALPKKVYDLYGRLKKC